MPDVPSVPFRDLVAVLGDLRDDKDVLIASESGLVRAGALEAARLWGGRPVVMVRDSPGPGKEHIYTLGEPARNDPGYAGSPRQALWNGQAWRLGDEACALPPGFADPVKGRVSAIRVRGGTPESADLETEEGRHIHGIPMAALFRNEECAKAAKAGKEG